MNCVDKPWVTKNSGRSRISRKSWKKHKCGNLEATKELEKDFPEWSSCHRIKELSNEKKAPKGCLGDLLEMKSYQCNSLSWESARAMILSL